MTINSVCILDYGSGNTMSVFNLIEYLGFPCTISNKEEDIISATHLILPGVGSFASSMKKIKNNLPIELLKDEVLVKKKLFLGICVGMQVLASYGYEFEKCEGLGWVEGEVVTLNTKKMPLPHIGWNNVYFEKGVKLFYNLENINDFYFVHSYIFKPKNLKNILSISIYDKEEFCSSLNQDNIFGVQFHPEKSQKTGQQLIKNFLNL